MSDGFTRIARVALIAVASAIVAGCTTWEIPEDVAKKMGVYTQAGPAKYLTFTQLGNRGFYYCASVDEGEKFGNQHCTRDNNKKLTEAQLSIWREYLSTSTDSDDEAAESTPVPGQIDTSVPGGTPSTCGGLYNPC